MSKFISFAHPVNTAEEAKEIIKRYQKEYFDARHVCWAYMIGTARTEYQSNDNGEPSGTAGKPILGQINSFELTNVVIVVIRYFGGIKLGTSGLIVAYREAAAEAIRNGLIPGLFGFKAVAEFSAFPEKGANWVNAIYRLKQPVESLKNAVGIRYEIRLTGKSGIVGSETERNFETATLGLLKSSSADQTIYRESVWIPTRIPNDVWQEVYLPFPVATASWKENASKYQAVAFGLNPEFLSLEFELRNIRIVYAD